MAEKRSLVAAVLSVSGLSDMFTQDMENEDFMNQEVSVAKADDTISNKQLKYLFTVAGTVGLNADDAKAIIAEFGYKSSKDIKVADYDSILEAIRNKGDSANA
jgi:hypothetical protein